MKRVILCPNPYRDSELTVAKRSRELLEGLGFETVVCLPFSREGYDDQLGVPIRQLQQEIKRADMLIAFGGDGTILHLARTVALHNVPVLGINLGRVGYMAELELGELDLLSRLFAVDSAGNPMWHTETRSMLGVEILTAAREVRASMYGLNDAVITNGSIARIIDIELYENGRLVTGYRADGLIQTQAEADEYNNTYDLSFISGKPWTPGDVKYRDLNGDKKINNGLNTLDDMGDMTVIGNTTPRYQYTINGSISWKGVTVSAMFQGVAKRDWDPGTGAYFWGSGPYAQVTVFKEHLDYWSETNTGAYYPKPYIHTAGGVVPFRNKTMTLSDRYLQSGAYCRLKNLTVSYDIPAVWTKKVGLQKVQVFFSGENLLTFTTLKGMFDPEAIFTKNDYTAEGGKNYPMNKVISFGLVVNL